MDMQTVIKASALALMVSGFGLNTAKSAGLSDIWSKVRDTVEEAVDPSDIDHTTEHGQSVLSTLEKYASQPEKVIDMEVHDGNSHIHTTVHHLLAAKDALQEEIEDLPEEASQKTREFIDDIHHAMNTLTTLDASHKMLAEHQDEMDEEGNSTMSKEREESGDDMEWED
jgi:hypothetical protein